MSFVLSTKGLLLATLTNANISNYKLGFEVSNIYVEVVNNKIIIGNSVFKTSYYGIITIVVKECDIKLKHFICMITGLSNKLNCGIFERPTMINQFKFKKLFNRHFQVLFDKDKKIIYNSEIDRFEIYCVGADYEWVRNVFVRSHIDFDYIVANC